MSKLRREARERGCLLRIPGHCNGDISTTVLCHLPAGGVGIKSDDFLAGAWGCSSCHDAVDGRVRSQWDAETLRHWHKDGVLRTQATLVDEGVVEIVIK